MEELSGDELRAALEATIPSKSEKRICMVKGCGLTKVKGKHRCTWHMEASRPPDERAQMAAERRAGWDGKRVRGDGSCSSCGADVPTWYRAGARCKSCNLLDRREHAFGLSAEDQQALIQYSGGRCFSCYRNQHFKSLATDHLHGTNFVRGLLCQDCNHKIIGSAMEDQMWLLRCVVYMIAPPGYSILKQEGAPAPLTDRQIGFELFGMLKQVLRERDQAA